MNKKEAVDNLRNKTLERVTNFFSADREDVQQTKTGTIMFPAVDELGAECFVTITVQIPKGCDRFHSLNDDVCDVQNDECNQ